MRYYIIGVLLFFFGLISCSSDDLSTQNVGSEFLENEININNIDNFKVTTQTYKADPFVTSGTGRILLGNTLDESLGNMKISSFFQVSSSSFSYDIDDEATFKSIGFVMHYDDYHRGDTTNNEQTYKLYTLNEAVYSDEDAFYNDSWLNHEDTSIGEVTFNARPNITQDSIYIPFNDIASEEIGNALFTKIQDEDLETEDDLLAIIRGFAIIPEESENGLVLSFNVETTEFSDNNSSMRIYYTSEDGEDVYVDFPITNLNKQFNTIASSSEDTSLDLSNTDISDLQDAKQIVLSDANIAISQAMSGLTSKISFPDINEIKTLSDLGSVLSAELVFSPTKETFALDNELPETINVFKINEDNELIEELTDFDNEAVTANLVENSVDHNGANIYTVDVSDFVQEILTSETNLNYSLALTFTDVNSTVRSIAINADDEESNLKLTVKYLNY